MNGRLAALDVGDKRIGVAVCDPLRLTAQPVGVVQRRGAKADCAAISALLAEYQIEKVVVGLPLSFSGSEGEQADRVRHFADRFQTETGLAVVYQDERLTTLQSERMLVGAGVRRDKRRQVIDKVAAALILQAYLDSQPRPA